MAHNLQLQQLCRGTLPAKNVSCRSGLVGRGAWSSSAAAAAELKKDCYSGSGWRSSSSSLLCGDSIREKSSAAATPGRCGVRIFECSKMSEAEIIPPEGISKNVTIPNYLGERLAGIIADTGSRELCILCHGLRSSKKSATLGVVASTLVTAGFSTFRFDFSGNGESEGQFSYGNYWKEVEDLRAVIQYWRNEGREVAAILGHSKGGNVVILYSSKYGDVSTVVNVSGRFDLNVGHQTRFGEAGMRKLEQDGFLDVKDKQGDYRVTLKGLQDRLSTDMDGAAKSISKSCRVLTVHGSADEVVKVEDAHFFAERIPNHVLRIFAGANHNYEGQRKQLAAVVLDFVQGNVSKI